MKRPKKRPVKILFLLHSSGLSGAERLHLDLVNLLRGKNFETCSLVPFPDQGIGTELKKNGSQVIYIENPRWWTELGEGQFDTDSLFEMFKSEEVTAWANALKPDLIITHTGVIPQAAIASSSLGIPHVWYLHEFMDLDHGLQFPGDKSQFISFVLKKSSEIWANSNSILEYFNLESNEMSYVVYHAPEKPDIRFFPTILDEISMTIIANFQEGKGHDLAFSAMERLLSDGVKVTLNLVGSGTEKDIYRLRALVKKHGLETHLKWHGFLPETSEVLKRTNIVIVPSRNESFGRVAFEAIELGIPVVYSSTGGMKEYMDGVETGFAFDPNSEDDCYKQLRYLITNYEKVMKKSDDSIERLDMWRKKMISDQIIVQRITKLLS